MKKSKEKEMFITFQGCFWLRYFYGFVCVSFLFVCCVKRPLFLLIGSAQIWDLLLFVYYKAAWGGAFTEYHGDTRPSSALVGSSVMTVTLKRRHSIEQSWADSPRLWGRLPTAAAPPHSSLSEAATLIIKSFVKFLGAQLDANTAIWRLKS